MNKKVAPKIMSGFMELLPTAQISFNKIKQIIQETYESYGFTPLDTPVLELSEVLLAKAGGDTEKQIYRFTKGDTDMCMRFDLTVPLSRYVAKNQNDLAFPFRAYHIDKSYRGERPQKGRFREFYQADIDIIGNEKLSVIYDAEIPAIMYTILTKLGLKRFHIRMNNRKLLHGFYQALGLEEQATDILRLIDKWDKIGEENVRIGLQELNLKKTTIDKIISFVSLSGTPDELLQQLSQLDIQNESFSMGVQELKTVSDALKSMGVPQTHYCIDLKITRGLDYYTGTVYETIVDDYPTWGSICSGGRYDNLAGYYTDKKLPGVGMSIGLTRLYDFLNSAGLIQMGGQTTTQVLILPMTQNMSYPLHVAKTLRDNHIKTEVYLAEAKFKNKMVYANKTGVPYVIILGEDEEQNNCVSLKNMETGEQKTIALADISSYMTTTLGSQPEKPLVIQE